MKPTTIFEKIWNDHIVDQEEGKPALLYIDLHLVHEVTSPQAFEGLRLTGREVRRPDLTYATMDHNVPTKDRFNIEDPISKQQIDALYQNCEEFNIPLADLSSPEQGIVHIIGPEMGLTQPGKTIVCGDSHTSTHGAFGALAFGIGTSEVEHVLATQCLQQTKPKTLNIKINGSLPVGTTAKDLILYIIGQHGTSVGAGHVIEFTGEAIEKMTMEERMTVCNMSIEAGARAGLITPDETTFRYLEGRHYTPKGQDWTTAIESWKKLVTDPGAVYDQTVEINAADIIPQVTWGTTPSMGTGITKNVPNPEELPTVTEQQTARRALEYMELIPGTPITDIKIDRAFIGSCTNGRIEDLRAAAQVVKGYKVVSHVNAMIVPGSQTVKKQAEQEGLDKIFVEAGFEWRESGCSMCLGMNSDVLKKRERCASTSNRNFEGRMGRNSKTHLLSPAMVAAAAIKGHFTDVREWTFQ
ncbi:3-isopropylmalate dehydratase large subunit [Peribacillus butanolivorans]|uniref:3-isopropylmalate dehydratase large subunit n=1 Tax=Peribacillus butanolivorans TaxID=421767 RepID=UPI0030C9435E